MWVKKCAEFTLFGTVFEIQALLCFQFLQKILKFKMAAIFGGTNFFLKIGSATQQNLWVKIFVKIALSSTVFEIQPLTAVG